MTDPVPPLILVAALTTLLEDALEQTEARQFADDGLRANLRELRGRVETELESRSGRARLRVAGEPDSDD